MFACMCVCICACMRVGMFVCMYVFLYVGMLAIMSSSLTTEHLQVLSHRGRSHNQQYVGRYVSNNVQQLDYRTPSSIVAQGTIT